MTTQNNSTTSATDWSRASGATKRGPVSASGALQLSLHKFMSGIMTNLESIQNVNVTEYGPVTSELEEVPNGGFRLTVKYEYPDEPGSQMMKSGSMVLSSDGPGKGVLEINGPNPGTIHISASPHVATKQIMNLVRWELEHSRGRPGFRPNMQMPIGLAS